MWGGLLPFMFSLQFSRNQHESATDLPYFSMIFLGITGSLVSTGRQMRNYLRNLFTDQSGAVTVDWVALTAGLVILASAVGYAVRDGTIDADQDLQAQVKTFITP